MPKDASDQAGEHQPGTLAIALLGGFRVVVAGRAIDEGEWQQRRAGDLMKTLALAPGHGLHAEKVTETLWPEADAEAGARNVQQALHRARNVLESGLERGSASLYLKRGADQVIRLAAPGGVWVDVEAYRAARTAARQSGTIEMYEDAVRRYTGDLLPHDAYQDWTIRQRELLRESYIELLAELAARYTAGGDSAAALATLTRLVETEPAHEGARAALMRLHAQAGRRYHALRHYQQLRAALRDELETEPSAATQRLYGEICTGALPIKDGARVADPAADAGDVWTVPLPNPSPHPSPSRGEGKPDSPPLDGEGSGERFATSFIGRVSEIVAVTQLLATERVVTLRGTGGSGKTRLAERVASGLRDSYRDGVWWVGLAPLADGRLVAQTMAAALGVREEHGRPLVETVARELADRDLLLVLDNCEHVVADAAALAAALLPACPRLRILATSRLPLRLAQEHVWRVPAMAAPDPDDLPPFERLGEYDAIRLFATRAAAQRPGFALTAGNAAAVVRICSRLDGIPLAIELAAARLRLLSADELAARLDDALALLVNADDAVVPRQRTLRAVLDWSYDLLGADERTLFRRLAVFAGGWSLDAAEAVGAGDGIALGQVLGLLERLADASLVMIEERDGSTHHRLLEMVRRYAMERLEASGERERVSRRHAEWYLALVEAAEPQFVSDRLKEWMERLDVERDNVRAALVAAEERGAVALGLRLTGAVWRYWYHRGLFVEGRRWLEAFLAADQAGGATPGQVGLARVKALLGLGQITLFQGDLARAHLASDEAVTLARAGGLGRELSIALAVRGGVAEYRNAFATAEATYRESLAVAQEIGDTWRVAVGWSNLADVARAQGHYADAAAWYGECLALARRIKDTRSVAMSLTNVGHMALLQGDARAALGPLEESLALFHELKDARGIGEALLPLGHATFEIGDRPRADACFVEGLAVFQASNNSLGTAHCLEGLAVYGERSPAMAARLLAAAATLRETLGTPLEPNRKSVFERATNELRASLGDQAFAAAWAIGRALPLERIIAGVRAGGATGDGAITRRDVARHARDEHPSAPLTPREREVAALVAQGLKDKEIGAALGMAGRTASTHVGNILNKLHLPTREALGRWWRRELAAGAAATED